MTYEQVETFLAAVSGGTISAAAEALFVSQSTVSSRIQLLEQELGIPLLIRLSINTFHSTEINSRVQSRDVDMGFVFSQRIRYPEVISRPVYRELMYLICQKDSPYYEGIHPRELDVGKEVFLRWGQDYQQWHDRYWNPSESPLITVNTGSMLKHYMTEPGRWAIAPMSVVQVISRSGNLAWYRMQESPAPRICYQLINRYPKTSHQQAIDRFNEELDTFIKENPSICTFEKWMLENK